MYKYKGVLYPQLEAEMLWSLTHFNGSVEGIAKQNGEYYFAYCHQNVHSSRPRYYWLYKLTDREYALELEYHNLYRKYRGWHTDYENNRRIKLSDPRMKRPSILESFIIGAKRLIYGTTPIPDIDKSDARKGIGDRKKYLERTPIGFFHL